MSIIISKPVYVRIRAIDAGRGLAMLLVFLAHFMECYLILHKEQVALQKIFMITRIASPTFMLISGTMLGYLFYIKKGNFGPTKRKYIDRGLFLITIGHILIRISWIPMLQQFAGGSDKATFITDTIGFCLIVSVIIISRINIPKRIILAIILFCMSWLVTSFPNPRNSFLDSISELFWGELHNKYFFDNFPFLPWFSIFLIGTVIGEKIGVFQKNNRMEKIGLYLFTIASICISASIIIHKIFSHLHIGLGGTFNAIILDFLAYHQKDPPSLVYFLFYGGVGLMILFILNMLIEKKYLNSIINILELIGKNSLIAFIIQYFIYFSILISIGPKYGSLWPLVFLITVFIQIIIIKFWDKKNLNRYLTVLDIPFRKIFILPKIKL